MAVTFDTLKAATRLREEAGFSEKQATELVATFADGFVENLATKDDVEHLRADMENRETSLRGDIGKMALGTDLERRRAGSSTSSPSTAPRWWWSRSRPPSRCARSTASRRGCRSSPT